MTETADRPGPAWRFWIDVGGTFTDCVARSPSGEIRTVKVLSSSAVKGRVDPASGPDRIVDPRRRGEPEDLYRGFVVALLSVDGREIAARRVASSSGASGDLRPEEPFDSIEEGATYELRSPEEAPLLAIRALLGARLDEPLGSFDLRLGTTRGTNALLERRGARTALLTTAGFGDVLTIGYQDRPRLFDLEVRRPDPLHERVEEVTERVGAGGEVLVPLDEASARGRLRALRREGVESIAVCLLHAHRRPEHEERLARLARDEGFRHVVVSSRASPVPKLVPRGDTAVVDAYLTPVLEDYIGRIRASAPRARLQLLTSSGGLASPETFRGRDSILSGPAGGVVGVARVAEQAGHRQAIGFDMGGTSTDVSRWGGAFETRFETTKAGVRIAAPVLEIETVAAGGGSICDFDGERMTVGPRSGGARPGPACYGAGGPLTVTDANFWLGRVTEDRFPFPLDRPAVARRLEEIRRRLRAAGHSLTGDEIAAGYLEIACARMAGAIRKISVARGYDVREHVLVAFGGAGAMHVCAVARQLGVGEVLVPRLAGVLSAQGAGLADCRRFVERPVLEPLGPGTRERLAPRFRSLEEEALAELAADGVPPSRVEPPVRRLEIRYSGQDATLAVDADSGDPRARFEREHERLYGYVHAGRALEVVAMRVECVGRSEETTVARGERGVDPVGRGEEIATGCGDRDWDLGCREALFDGRRRETRIFDAERLPPGEVLAGPAIGLSRFHTTVIEPGWEVRRSERGDWVLTRGSTVAQAPAERVPAERAKDERAEPDPVRLEIFHQHFASIAEEMGLVLRRSALSVNVRERLDFSCAVFDGDGDLVANAPHIPVHLGALGDCVRQVSRDLPDLESGDVVVVNDPYRGGSHLPDVTVVTPVFDAPGESVLFWVASRAHHAEIGGTRPGSMPPDSRSLEEEGVVLRAFRVVRAGEPRFEELRRRLLEARYPSRSPDENVADVEAQAAANRTGVRLLRALIDRQGRSVVLAYMRHIQDAARRLMEDRIRQLPSERLEFEDALDDGTPIRVAITARDGRATVDFTGTGPPVDGNLNATPAIVSSAVLYCLRLLIGGEIPLNAGVLAPVRVVLPPSLLHPPVDADPARCHAVSGGNVETSQRVVDVVLGALGVVSASQGTMNNLLFGGADFGYYETIAGGAGAGPGFPGADAIHTHMTNTRITDPEVLEARYPVRVLRFAIRRGSGGDGRWRGGDGVVRELEFLAPVAVSIVSQRRTRRPYGLGGGRPAEAGRNLLLRAGAAGWEELGPLATFEALPGDRLRVETPGGGGYGEPTASPPAGRQ